MRTRTSRGKNGQARKQLIGDESNFPSSRDNEALERAITHATEFLSGLDERSVAPTVTLDELRSRLGSALAEAGIDPCQVIDDLVADTAGGHLGSVSGRFFAWVIGGSLPSALAADWLTSAWDQNAGTYACGPAAAVETA